MLKVDDKVIPVARYLYYFTERNIKLDEPLTVIESGRDGFVTVRDSEGSLLCCYGYRVEPYSGGPW